MFYPHEGELVFVNFMLDRVEFAPAQAQVRDGDRAHLFLVTGYLDVAVFVIFLDELLHIVQVGELVGFHPRVVDALAMRDRGLPSR